MFYCRKVITRKVIVSDHYWVYLILHQAGYLSRIFMNSIPSSSYKHTTKLLFKWILAEIFWWKYSTELQKLPWKIRLFGIKGYHTSIPPWVLHLNILSWECLLSFICRFTNGSELVLQREKSTIEVAGKEVASREQIPLALAWAVSIHKAQVFYRRIFLQRY